MQIKPKPSNKTKTNIRKTKKTTIFRARKLLRGEKLVILPFLKKIEIVLITSFNLLLSYSIVYAYLREKNAFCLKKLQICITYYICIRHKGRLTSNQFNSLQFLSNIYEPSHPKLIVFI